MGFPQSISEISSLHKAQSTSFPQRFSVSLTRQSEYDNLAAELKISLENNGTVTSNCVKFPVAISKLRSRTTPGNNYSTLLVNLLCMLPASVGLYTIIIYPH